MSVRAYVLIRSDAGQDQAVAQAIRAANLPDLRIVNCDAVIGSFDVVVEVEADDLDKLGDGLGSGLQRLPGVAHTTTCLVIRLP